MQNQNSFQPQESVDHLILGAGFAGICAAVQFQRAGLGSCLILEKAQDFGGTWRENTYPGCACDIPAHLYALSFAPNPTWSRMYATQPEIFAYLRRLAADYHLASRTRFGAEVQSAEWDAGRHLWRVTTRDQQIFEARTLFSALGPLHIPAIPTLPGLADFAGPAFHSANWDHQVDLAGKTIAVIGTGASAIQFIPHIAPAAQRLTVFQRTPPWILPKFDGEFSPRQQRLFKFPPYRALYRQWLFWQHELRALGFLGNAGATHLAERMARAYLARSVPDAALRDRLTPRYRLGCKRVLISNDYFPALCRDNVALITDGIARVEANAIIDTTGFAHPADIIIYGTGFHTTDSFAAVRVVGREGRELSAEFANGIHAHWGMAVPHFPNFFFLLGPNTGLGHNSVVLMIEAQVRYLVKLLHQARRAGWPALEVRRDVEAAWNEKLQHKLRRTIWLTGGCRSWYLDTQGRNTTLWPGFVAEYQLKTRRPALSDYLPV